MTDRGGERGNVASVRTGVDPTARAQYALSCIIFPIGGGGNHGKHDSIVELRQVRGIGPRRTVSVGTVVRGPVHPRSHGLRSDEGQPLQGPGRQDLCHGRPDGR
jgi:hypothetical protein